MFFVYVLISSVNGNFYVGMTEDIDDRIIRHNRGDNKSTKAHRPWKLFFFETCETRSDARKREVYLKGGSGKEYIKSRWLQSQQ